VLSAQAEEAKARATKYMAEAQNLPVENKLKMMDVAAKNIHKGAGDDQEFERRLRIAELRLKEKEMTANLAEKRANTESQRRLQSMMASDTGTDPFSDF
jgi:hypothetical protein